MTYDEATAYSLTVEWKTMECTTPGCWCRIITPKKEIQDKDGHEIYIAGSGCIPKKYAAHIVKLHNASLKQKANETKNKGLV